MNVTESFHDSVFTQRYSLTTISDKYLLVLMPLFIVLVVVCWVVLVYWWWFRTRRLRAVAAARNVSVRYWLSRYLLLRANLSVMSCLRPLQVVSEDAVVNGKQMILEHCSGPLMPNLREDIKATLATEPPKIEGGPSDHPQSAAIRAFGRNTCIAAARAVGRDAVCIFASQSEALTADDSTRQWIVPKDMKANWNVCTPLKDDVLILIDSDYFVDLARYLRGNVLILFTFIPDSAGETGNDYCFTLSDNQVSLHVGGSVTYKHALWDHSGDTRFIRGPTSDWVYEIYKVRLAPNRYIVVYQPIRAVYFHDALLESRVEPQRLTFSFGRANVIARDENLSISHAHTPKSYELPRDAFEAMLTRSVITPEYPLRLADVSACLPATLVKDHVAVSSIVSLLLSGKANLPNPNLQSRATKVSDHSYILLPRNVDEESKDLMHLICKPIITGSVAPVRSESTATNSVEKRVLGPQNEGPAVSTFMYEAMQEFIKRLVPDFDAHTLTPLTFGEVYFRQDRPSQRATARQAARRMDCDVNLVYQTFTKAEAYQSVTDARNIACPRTEYRLKKARFIYPFMKRIMVNHRWYVFGRTPVETARLVHNYVQDRDSIDSGDQSRMDGRHPRTTRLLVIMALVRAFNGICETEIRDLFNKLRKAYTPYNQTYTYLYQNASGDGETTFYNCIASAWLDFYMFAQMGMTWDQCFSEIGLIAGDDTLQDGRYAVQKEEVSTLFGFKYKSAIVQRGQPLVYLGRVYLNPWVKLTNICQPRRILTKLHLGHQNPAVVPGEIQCARKALAYMITDPHTPIVYEWCMHFHDTTVTFEDLKSADVSYMVKTNPPDAWIPLYPSPGDPEVIAYVAQDLGLTLKELHDLRTKIVWNSEPDEPYLVLNPEITVNAIVRDIPHVKEGEDDTLMSKVAPPHLVAPAPPPVPPVPPAPQVPNPAQQQHGLTKPKRKRHNKSTRAPLNNKNHASKKAPPIKAQTKATKK